MGCGRGQPRTSQPWAAASTLIALEDLAQELLSLILQNVDSPVGLHYLISASPSCFRTYSQSPQIIISSIIRNVLPGDNIQHALAILQAPSARSEVPSFLNKYFNSIASFHLPTNRADLLILSGLYNCLSHLLDNYFEETMRELGLPHSHQLRQENQHKSSPNKSVLPPSISERTRLQRAFLRFRLYCQVFPGYANDPYGLDDPSPPDHPADQQFSLFLANLTPWEAEEIVRGFIDELEDDLIHAVMDAPDVEKPAHDHLVDFKDVDLTDLVLFCRNGLDFMYSLAVSDKSKRAEMVKSNHHVTRPELATPHDIVSDDGPSHSNLGYRLFKKAPDIAIYPSILHSGFKYSSLRQLGYLFAATIITSDKLHICFDRINRETAEDRLKGTKLPKEQIERIEREFGIWLRNLRRSL
ncbi:hypothetical protein B0J13DRAFT_646158 [Dactylonectria estremocensis]|uniref:Uncharacterized protein n=1 Tax=Dactylonectria estremocensis TaxID=1079267 RepID=A0A9P9DZB5_9HYPO|nr:hypothetical protein B0J13DRAFT_646158 [Dactylonectria estremocensis]